MVEFAPLLAWRWVAGPAVAPASREVEKGVHDAVQNESGLHGITRPPDFGCGRVVAVDDRLDIINLHCVNNGLLTPPAIQGIKISSFAIILKHGTVKAGWRPPLDDGGDPHVQYDWWQA